MSFFQFQDSLVYDVIIALVMIIYGICVLIWFLYALSMLHIVFQTIKFKLSGKKEVIPTFPPNHELPNVTVQLPMYNEFHVAEAVIDSCAKFDYPVDKLEIQVLDDSTDESKDIVDRRVAYWLNKGIDIKVIRREKREGFKAGALAYATPLAKGEFIAIFDADFTPDPDFLMKALPYFDEDNVAVIQTKWGHSNGNYSLLTKLQALALDAFYFIEQPGRAYGGYYTRFNGSGGILRKKAIEDAGGWSADTLCEDLDLGYRAQLKGWKFKYTSKIVCNGEVPVTITGLKSQHYRWHKGKAECVKKLTSTIIKAKIPLKIKFHSLADLFNIYTTVALLGIAFLSIPFIYIFINHFERFEQIWPYYSLGLLPSPIIAYMMFQTLYLRNKNVGHSILTFIKQFPGFIFLFNGLVIIQTIATWDGIMGKKTPFVRTPKYNIKTKNDNWKGKLYSPKLIPISSYIEAFSIVFFIAALVFDFINGMWGFVPLHFFFTTGTFFAFWSTLTEIRA